MIGADEYIFHMHVTTSVVRKFNTLLSLPGTVHCHQISIKDFPPPDQWGANVVTFLKAMDMDVYRMILLDANLHVMRCLRLATENGTDHPSYAMMENVGILPFFVVYDALNNNFRLHVCRLSVNTSA